MKKPLPSRIETVDPKNLVRIGGPVDNTKVSLRIFGDTLEPDKITDLLGHKPTKAQRKGDVIPNKRYHLVAKTGCWILQSQSPGNESADSQIANLLGKITKQQEVWKSLTTQFQVDIFCGIFLDNINRGFTLSPTVIKSLAERGLAVNFDIYCP